MGRTREDILDGYRRREEKRFELIQAAQRVRKHTAEHVRRLEEKQDELR
jgi:hypothetical protein